MKKFVPMVFDTTTEKGHVKTRRIIYSGETFFRITTIETIQKEKPDEQTPQSQQPEPTPQKTP